MNSTRAGIHRRDFGANVEEQRTIGVLVIMLGVVALLPCCFGAYLLKQSITHRGRRRVLMPVELDGAEVPESGSSNGPARYEHKASDGKGGDRIGTSSGDSDAGNSQQSGKSGPSRLDEMRREAGSGTNTPFSKEQGSSTKGSKAGKDAVSLPPKVLEVFFFSTIQSFCAYGFPTQSPPLTHGRLLQAMLSFAADLGIAPADVTQYMWICEEALAPAVLGEWQPHVDERGAHCSDNLCHADARRLMT